MTTSNGGLHLQVDNPKSDCGARSETTRLPKPFLIGVAGGTASGKSTVCKKIVEMLDTESGGGGAGSRRRICVVSQECFYRQLDEREQALADKGQFDFDHPRSFNERVMIQTVRDLKEGKDVELPEYDYVNNRISDRMTLIRPADVILLEGILVFYFSEIRDACDMRLFVDTDADTRLSRRVMRDMKERGRGLETILSQYVNFVKPAFEEFCLPTKKYADVIIPRGADNKVAIDLIVQHIQDLLRHNVGGGGGGEGGRAPLPSERITSPFVNTDQPAFRFDSKDVPYTSAH